jgi:hypothetical protein
MVLKSAAEVASEAHEISHQQDSMEKKKGKIGRVKSVNIYPSKIKSKARKDQGSNETIILYSNRFYILSIDSDDEEDTEEVDQAALSEEYQGLAMLTGNFSNKQQYFFHDVSLQKKKLLTVICALARLLK